ncbi:MAG: Unknown protein [uncultured Thiotrichaceae bacterium]|uniref:Twin transmembrane helix small protein n=1 Tax=uncultured Thiotrichaceae bacterium TaxID=298394 RepID=A0A6S6TDY3_9GAMM|nr:MAG: Unknown protein [uncultured Thiotrichaceae bacterium]
MLLFKLIIVILLLFVIVTLFTALYQLNKSDGDSSAVVKTLAVRVGLSLFIVFLIGVGQMTGLITLNRPPF